MVFIDLVVSGGVATINLARPPVNALNFEMQGEVKAAAEECARRDDVRSVVIYGGESHLLQAPTSKRWKSYRPKRWRSVAHRLANPSPP